MYIFNDYSNGSNFMAKNGKRASSVHAICPPMASAMGLRILSISESPTDFSEAVLEGALIS